MLRVPVTTPEVVNWPNKTRLEALGVPLVAPGKTNQLPPVELLTDRAPPAWKAPREEVNPMLPMLWLPAAEELDANPMVTHESKLRSGKMPRKNGLMSVPKFPPAPWCQNVVEVAM
jgi:hypothetical protein